MAKCEFYTLVTTGFTLSLAHILLSSANAMSAVEEGGVGRGGPLLLPHEIEEKEGRGGGGFWGKKKKNPCIGRGGVGQSSPRQAQIADVRKQSGSLFFCVT